MATKGRGVLSGAAGIGRGLAQARMLASSEVMFLTDALFFPITLHSGSVWARDVTDPLIRVYGVTPGDDADLGFTTKLQSTTEDPDTDDPADWTDVPGATLVQTTGAPALLSAGDIPDDTTYIRTEITIDKFDVADAAAVRVEVWVNFFDFSVRLGHLQGTVGEVTFAELDIAHDLLTERF